MTVIGKMLILEEILEDSASNGGAHNSNDTIVTSSQMAEVVDRVLVGSREIEVRYQEAIRDTNNFSNPPTVTQVQAVIDTVNLDLSGLFKNQGSFNSDYIKAWDVSRVTNMSEMFQEASSFNQDISDWVVKNVTNMGKMFSGADGFNQDISDWDVSSVTNMGKMFSGADGFNQDIGNWDVSSATNMSYMFNFAKSFNQNLDNWSVANVTDMSYMFDQTRVFNGLIGSWDVGRVTNMSNMFQDTRSFNQDIGNWDVSRVTNMRSMFHDAQLFNQDISRWDISALQNAKDMFLSSNMSVDNYDRLLAGWATLNTAAGETAINTNVVFGGMNYTDATSHNHLTTLYGWDIDGGSPSNAVTVGTNAAETLDQSASATDKIIHGLDGNDTLIGGAGGDELVGGGGDDVLTGGAGADHFVFRFYGSMTGDTAETGHDTITDFDPAEGDIIEFRGPIFNRFNDILTSTSQDGDDVVIALDGHNSVRLAGTDLTEFRPSNFSYNVPPRIGDTTGSVAEDGTLVTSGAIDIDDPGASVDSDFTWVIGAEASFGSATIDGSGNWSYALDNDAAAVQAVRLNETLIDNFSVHTQDSAGNVGRTTISISIAGSNEAAVIGGQRTGAVARDDVNITQRTLTSQDVDGNDNKFTPETVLGLYGTLLMGEEGHWSYSLNNDNATVNALQADETLIDTIIVTAEDGTPQDITLTIRTESVVNLKTSLGDDTLIGNDNNNAIKGNRGNDIVFGKGGDDTLRGDTNGNTISDGNDWLDGGAGNDLLIGNAGKDRLFGGAGNDTLNGDYDNDPMLSGGDGNDLLNGGDGTDTLEGGAGNDTLQGGAGVSQDWLSGDDGNDELRSSKGGNTLFGGNGDDTLYSGLGDDTLSGDDGNDTLYGEDDNDTLDGGDGNDELVGGSGDDILTGGNDRDIFAFQLDINKTGGTAVTGHDTVTDFDPGSGDIIGFGGSRFNLFSDILASASQNGNDVVITVDADNSVRLSNTNLSDLHPSNFAYNIPTRIGDTTGNVIEDSALVTTGAINIDELGGKADSDFIWMVTDNGPIYGTATVDDNGDWTYTLDNNALAVQALRENETLADTFTVRTQDAVGNEGLTTITLTITGANEAAVISGRLSTDFGKNDTSTAFGSLTSSDVDGNDNVFKAATVQGDYGHLTIDAAGKWTYYVDKNNGEVKGLGDSDTVQDNITIQAEDGTAQDITITIRSKSEVNLNATDLEDILIGTDLDDTINAGKGRDFVYGYAGDDVLDGEGGDDTLNGFDGNDTLDGGDDDDRLIGGSGNDSLVGGSGDDNLGGGHDNDTLYGDDGDDRVDGGSGDDWLYGGNGDDGLLGFDGNDYLNAGAGNDVLHGFDGNDTLYGYEDNDTLWGGLGDDKLYGYYGEDLIYGEDGDDRLYAGPGNDTLYGDSGNDYIQGVAGADFIEGGDGNDTLNGGIDSDTLLGGTGNDSLDGGVGEDLIEGGDGDDTLLGGIDSDTLFGGAGNDSLDGGDGEDSIDGGAGHDTLKGGVGNASDRLYGRDGNDSLDGGGGDDAMTGDHGDDTLSGGDGDDKLYGWDDNDLLDGGAGADTLDGNIGNDTLIGGDGHDMLSAGDDDDLIDGGAGDDAMTGGRGADTFVFAANSGADKITDFDYSSGDVIDLSNTGTGYSSIQDLVDNSIEVGAGQGVWINLGDGNTLFLSDYTLADLNNFTQDSFVF